MSISEILRAINTENMHSVLAVERALPEIEKATELMVKSLKSGGKVYYCGAGTSGRLAVMDAVEKGDITEERINESVLRIIEKKLTIKVEE